MQKTFTLGLVCALFLSACGSPLQTSLSGNLETNELPIDQGLCEIELSNPQTGGELSDHYVYTARAYEGEEGIVLESSNEHTLESASVPDGVLDINGETWLYFVHGEREKHGIWVAKQNEEGEFKPLTCITIDGEFKPRGVDPDVYLDEDGQFVLTYYANFPFGPYTPKAGEKKPESEFFQAVSTDGIHFETRSQLFQRPDSTDPTAIQFEDGSWLVAWPEHPYIYFTESKNGEEWKILESTLDFPPNAGIPELALLENDELLLFIGGDDLYAYRSTDRGQSWTKENLEITGSQHAMINHPSFVDLGDEWLVFLNVTNKSTGENPDTKPGGFDLIRKNGN